MSQAPVDKRIAVTLTDAELAAAIERVSDAVSQKGKWQMCVPPQADDSDVLVYEAAKRLRGAGEAQRKGCEQ